MKAAVKALEQLNVFLFGVESIKGLHRLLIPAAVSNGTLRCSEHANRGTYIVNTIPPLMINLANRGTAPDQNVRTPSSRKIRAAHTKLFLYSFLASIDCMLRKISPRNEID